MDLQTRRLRLFLPLGGLLAALVWLSLGGPGCRRTFLRSCAKFSSPETEDAGNEGYAWVSEWQFMSFDVKSGTPSAYLYSLMGGARTNLPHVDRLLAAVSRGRPLIFSARTGWLLLYAGDRRGYAYYLTKIDGSATLTNQAPQPLSECFWMPQEISWVAVAHARSPPQAWIWRFPKWEPARLDPSIHPGLPVGFANNGDFLSATNDVPYVTSDSRPFFPKEVVLERWDIAVHPPCKTTARIRLAGDEITLGRASPGSDLIAWVCWHRLRVPEVLFTREFPFVVFQPRCSTRIYVSSPRGDDVAFVGEIPETGISVQWRPDGRSLSFVHNGAMYIAPIKGDLR